MSHFNRIQRHALEATELIRIAQAYLIETRPHEDPLLKGYYGCLIEFNETLMIMLAQGESTFYDPNNRALKLQQYKAIQKLEDLAAKSKQPDRDPAVRTTKYYQACLSKAESAGRPGRLLSFVAMATCAAVQVMPKSKTSEIRPIEQLLVA
jgi:hypothetical protein